MAKGLDVSGTHIKYFGSKRDAFFVQGRLFDAKLRWKRLTVRTHEKGRHLQQAYRKSKQVIRLFHSLVRDFQVMTRALGYLAKCCNHRPTN